MEESATKEWKAETVPEKMQYELKTKYKLLIGGNGATVVRFFSVHASMNRISNPDHLQSSSCNG